MWRRRKFGKTPQPGLEDLRIQRRERETALRKARREQQLISKRLLRDVTDEDKTLEENERSSYSEEQVVQLVKDVHHGSADKLKSLTALRQSLQNKDAQLMFVSSSW